MRRTLFAVVSFLAVLATGTLSYAYAQQPPASAPTNSSQPPAQTPAAAAAPATPTTPPASAAPNGSATPAPAVKAPAPSTAQAEALDLYRTGKFQAAAEAYTKLIPSDPGTAYAGLTRVYLRQRRADDAYASITKGVELAPNVSDVHVALAEVYYRQGKIIEADHELVKVVNSGARSARAYLDLAKVAETASYYGRAKKMIEMAHRTDPEDPDVRREWLFTLPIDQRVKELKAYLAATSDDDESDRARLVRWLVNLEGETGKPQHSCEQVNKVTSTQTKLEPLMNDPRNIRGYGLVVNVNGTNAKLMLDTGAGGITIDRRVAERAGIKALVESEIGGIGSKAAASGYAGFADVIKIGELEFHNCIVEVVDKRSVLDDEGLIGADVFENYLVDINLPDAKFSLSPLPVDPKDAATTSSLESDRSNRSVWRDPYVSPEMKEYSGVYRVNHMLLIPTSLNDKPPKNFLIDTGAFDNTIDIAAAKEVSKVHGDEYDTVRGLSGKVNKVYTADKVKIRFSRFQQDRNDLIAFDLSNISNGAGIEISGTLGFAMLRMLDIKIDYRDGMVNFTYDKNRFH